MHAMNLSLNVTSKIQISIQEAECSTRHIDIAISPCAQPGCREVSLNTNTLACCARVHSIMGLKRSAFSLASVTDGHNISSRIWPVWNATQGNPVYLGNCILDSSSQWVGAVLLCPSASHLLTLTAPVMLLKLMKLLEIPSQGWS